VTVTSNTAGSYVNTIPIGGVDLDQRAAERGAGDGDAGGQPARRPGGDQGIRADADHSRPDVGADGHARQRQSAAINGVAFTDTYPAEPGERRGAERRDDVRRNSHAAAGGGTVALANGTIPANGNCTVTVTVTSNINGSYVNTIPVGGVSSTNAAANTVPATATLVVDRLPAPTVDEGVRADADPDRADLDADDHAANAMHRRSMARPLPTPIRRTWSTPPCRTARRPAAARWWQAPVAAPSASTNGTIPANGNCTVTVTVTSSTAGNYVNTIPAGGLTSTNAQPSAAPATATLVVNALAAPTVTKTFAPPAIFIGQTSTITSRWPTPIRWRSTASASPIPIRPG
jgi:hypothetical protein